MKLPVPPDYHILVVRTDFSDDSIWNSVCDMMWSNDCEGYVPDLVLIEDPGFAGIAADELQRTCADPDIGYVFVVDSRAITDPEHPVLVVDLDPDHDSDRPARSFRALPSEVSGIDANLGISNMDFWEFAESVDADGVFRGFPEPSL